MNHNDLLYTNTFFSDPNLIDNGIEQNEKFRQYYENKTERESQERAIRILNNQYEISDLINTNEYVPGKASNNMGFLPNYANQGTTRQNLTGNKSSLPTIKRVTVPRARVLNIDSRDRDLILYPHQNNFKISLRKVYRNIRSIRLISLEFPNSDFAFKTTPESLKNVVFYWSNKSDPILEENNYGMLNRRYIYNVEINPGNYSATSLTTEISTKMNSIRRDEENPNSSLHSFSVSINLDTDLLSMSSILLTNLEDDPLSVTNGSIIVTITQASHPHSVGDTIILTGATAVANHPRIGRNNRIYTVETIPSSDTFTVLLPFQARATVVGGGSNVQVGILDKFMLYFGRFTDTPGQELGFALEDTSSDIPDTNQFSIKVRVVENITVGYPTTITSTDHGFITGDKVKFLDVNTTPVISNNTIFTVEYISTSTFTIDFETTIADISTFSTSSIISNKITVQHPLHGLNQFLPSSVSITAVADESSFIARVTTATEHNLQTNDNAIISGCDAVPDINGNNTITRIDDTSFTIEIGASTLSTLGTTGVVGLTITAVSDNSIIIVTSFNSSFTFEESAGGGLVSFNLTEATYSSATFLVELASKLDANSVNGYTYTVDLISNQIRITTTANFTISVDTSSSITGFIVAATPAAITHTATQPITDEEDNTAIITTNTSHGLQTGNVVSISDCDAVITGSNNINEYFEIIRLSSTRFSIIIVGDVTTPGTTGDITLSRDSIRIYRCEKLGSIQPRFINNIDHIVTVLNTSSYSIELDEKEDDSYSTINVTAGGGDDIRVSSRFHGYSGEQTNTSDGSLINRLISLEGENYAYITSQIIGSTMEDSSGVTNIFGKLLLNFSPGTIAFNSFIENPRIFDDNGPLKELSEIDIKVKIHNDILYEFNDIDFSFALEIVELVDIIPNTQFSSVRGEYDVDMVGTGIGSLGRNANVGSGAGGQIGGTIQPIEQQDFKTGQVRDEVSFREFATSGI